MQAAETSVSLRFLIKCNVSLGKKKKKMYLKQLGGRAVLLRKAIMATVIHGRLNLSAISRGAAVNSPNAVWGDRGGLLQRKGRD